MQAVAYLRVSGDSQVEAGGFDRQLEACQRLARDKGLTLVQSFKEEAVSGTKGEDERPAFQELVAYMVDHQIEVVLIEGLDRLARMMRVQEQLLLYLCSKNLTLYAANTGENITEAIASDPMKKALIQIQGVFAELDRSMIVAKLRKGRETRKAKHGRCEGQKPFGHYEVEAETLRHIHDLRSQGLHFHIIADRLNAERLPTRSGRPWSGQVIAKMMRRKSAHEITVADRKESNGEYACMPGM